MARARGKVFTLNIPTPLGGINMAVSPEKLKLDQAMELAGWEIQEYGVIGAPYKSNWLGSPVASGCLSLHRFMREGGATQLIGHWADGSLRYSTDALTATSSSATWTTIATGLSTTVPIAFETYLGAVWMACSTSDFRKWDGSSQTTYASAPKGKYLRVWNDVMWLSGVSGNEHRLYSSAPGDPTSWPAANFVDIDKGRGLGIRGLGATGASLAVFKHDRHHQLYDPVEYSNRLVDPSKGCLSHFSIVPHDGQLYFVSAQGICRYLGDAPAEIISDPVGPLFDDIFRYNTSYGTAMRAVANEASIWGYSFKDHVGWTIPMAAQAESFAYFPRLPDQPWFRPSLPLSGPVVTTIEPGAIPRLYVADKAAGALYRVNDQANADQSSVACKWVTPWFDMDSPLDEKYIEYIQLARRGGVSVKIRKDYDWNGAGTTLFDGTTSATDMEDYPIYCDVHGRSFQLIIEAVGTADVRQYISAGGTSYDTVARYQSSVGSIRIHGRTLGEYRR